MANHPRGSLRTSRVRSRPRRIAGPAAVILALALCAGLGACSSDPSWPTIGKVSDLSDAMTPAQREKVLQDLQKGDHGQNGTAATGSQAKQGQ
jgi:hypothetical protein